LKGKITELKESSQLMAEH
jgi:hypothetical protein